MQVCRNHVCLVVPVIRCGRVQASCRASLYGNGSRCANAVPQSHDAQLSLLRQAFQCADRRERQQVCPKVAQLG